MPVQYIAEAAGTFDLSGQAMCVATDWPTARTPWLARDLDRDGSINDGGELFGSATRMQNGQFAQQGFDALSELDDDLDGLLTPRDPSWSSLTLWADSNADRSSQPGETGPLSSRGVRWIDLHYHVRRVCDSRGNCGIERASFGYVGADGQEHTGEVVDVHLLAR